MRHRRWGIFGGTFDPPHYGHLLVASDAFESLSLDRLVFVPAASPPHKRDGVAATGEQRLAMIRAAVEGDSRFGVDDVEVQRGGVSYTVDTLRHLRTSHPDVELLFLLGADQFKAFASWRDPEEVSRLATLAVLARGGETLDLGGAYRAIPAPVRRVDISSTEVRARLGAGQTVRYLVPQPVLRIIQEERLYSLGK